MAKLVLVALLLFTLLMPGIAAAWPVECWYAADSGKWYDWLWCGAVLVFMEVMQPGENGYYPGPE